MRFIHIADVHLGMVPDSGMPWSEKARDIIWDSISEVVEICNLQKIDLLLIAGDLFHRHPLLKELKEVNYIFSKLKHTRVVLIAGNHDYITERSHYGEFSWCSQVTMLKGKDLETIDFPEINTEVYGFSYHQRDITEYKYNNAFPKQNNRIHILLAHGGDEKDIPINKNNLIQLGYDYIALGHIHKKEKIHRNIAYSGSLEPLDKTETGTHGYIFGEAAKGQCRIQFVPFSSRQYYHIMLELTPNMTNREILDIAECSMRKIPKKKQNIIKFILTGLRNGELVPETDRLYQLGNVIQVVDESVPDYNFDELYLANKNNIIGKYIDRIRQLKETDAIAGKACAIAGKSCAIADKALYYGIEALFKAKE